MPYTLEEIKADLITMSVKSFYTKYILRSGYWYFEHILSGSPDKTIGMDDFKEIACRELDISFNNIALVGSAKLGYSLSPKKEKLFARFRENDTDKPSDIDVAIISNRLFQRYWDMFRMSYQIKHNRTYNHISREIYRGYINERNLFEIPNCRKEWESFAKDSKKALHNSLYIRHEITYRLYRSWEDFEEYNLQSLKDAKEILSEPTIS